jgi:copper chaperone CopZ
MEKLVYLLWAETDIDAENLRDDVATQLLGIDGVRGVQINISDPAVAGAMLRITNFDRPVTAVASVWVDSAAHTSAALGSALSTVCVDIAGYLVTESVAIEPPRSEAGERTPGLANVAILRRPADLDRDEWLDRWLGPHTRVAIETQDTFGYVRNAVVRAVTPGASPVDGIVEELFPIAALSDPHAFYGSAGDDTELTRRITRLMTSVATFGADRDLDVVPTSRYVLRQPFAPL